MNTKILLRIIIVIASFSSIYFSRIGLRCLSLGGEEEELMHWKFEESVKCADAGVIIFLCKGMSFSMIKLCYRLNYHGARKKVVRNKQN